MMATKNLFFFVGTEAELMKLFPVILRARERGYACQVIANRQNDISHSPFLELSRSQVDVDICKHPPTKKQMGGYLRWLLQTARNGKKVLRSHFAQYDKAQSLMIVHGDTLSTAMGAWIANRIGMPYAHIESGLRSFNYLSPFPEEIDRFYGSLHAKINFCPGEEYAKYAAERFSGVSVDTVYNTGIETLFQALAQEDAAAALRPQGKYFLSMLHRQENLMSKKFLRSTVEQIVQLVEKIPCVFIFHAQTREALQDAGAYAALENHPNITLLPRQPYNNFIHLVLTSEFIITDGCGNQQEFYYLGKPYLIMRTQVERDSEGLKSNAKVFDGDFGNILRFYDDYKDYIYPRIEPVVKPSDIIVDALDAYFAGTLDKDWSEKRQATEA